MLVVLVVVVVVVAVGYQQWTKFQEQHCSSINDISN